MAGINKIQWAKSELISDLNELTDDEVLETPLDIVDQIDTIINCLNVGAYGEVPGLSELRADLKTAWEFTGDPEELQKCIDGLVESIQSGEYD